MENRTEISPRFVVEKLGPRAYYVYDTVTCLSRYPSFTRRGAQKVADRKNAAQASS
ncbi:hypothetical protein ACN2WE_05150 [Streptomyces sp. cg28]|uniref:hypothetical protein n=1 Tax=Streptomyces sp. cg28 TaxID=3403457 RepID=UPI003B20E4CE